MTFSTKDLPPWSGPMIVNAGCWIISGSFHVYVTQRPNWLHRTMTRLLLGWRWEDAKQ